MLRGNIYYEYVDLRPDQVGRVFNEGLWNMSMNIFLDKNGLLVSHYNKYLTLFID
jgi:hypothetical protein